MGFFERRKERKRQESDQNRLANMGEDEFWEKIEIMEKGSDPVEEWKRTDQDSDSEEVQSFDPFSSDNIGGGPALEPYYEGDGALPFGRSPRYVPTLKSILKLLKLVSKECPDVERTREYKIFFDKSLKMRLKQPEFEDTLCAGEIMAIEVISTKPLPESKLDLYLNIVRNQDPKRTVDRLVSRGYIDDKDPFLVLKKYKADELKELMEQAGIENPKGTKPQLIECFYKTRPKEATEAMKAKGNVYSVTPKGEELLARYPYFRRSYEGEVIHYLDAYQLNLLMHDQPDRPLIDALDEMYSKLALNLFWSKSVPSPYYEDVLDCMIRMWAKFNPEKACRIAMHMFAFKCRSAPLKPTKYPTMIYLLENTMDTVDEILEIMEDEKKYTALLSKYNDSVIPALRQAFRFWPDRF